MRSTSRVNSFSTILQLKIFNEMERCLCFNWFYRFTWPCVLYPRDATVVEEHALGSFIGSFAFRRSFFFRTRPGFHKILDPFFPYWTKQVWQSTLFYKQMITSFFPNWKGHQLTIQVFWGEKDVLYFQKIESSPKQPIMQHVLSEILKQFCCLKNSGNELLLAMTY